MGHVTLVPPTDYTENHITIVEEAQVGKTMDVETIIVKQA